MPLEGLEVRRIVVDSEAAEAIARVTSVAFAMGSFSDAIRWTTAAEPDGVFGCFDGDQLVGTSLTVAFPDAGFGWIGLVATLPSHTRRGIGQAVTQASVDFLRERGCGSVLDASRFGAPVYERMGFRDLGLTTAMVHDGSSGPGGEHLAERIDLDELVEFDRIAFGAERRALLAPMLLDLPDRVVTVRGADGSLRGAAIGQTDTIGPLIVADAGVLPELLARALALPWSVPPRVLVPPGSPHFGALEALGFAEARALRHMHLDAVDLRTDVDRYVGRISFGVG